MRLESITPEWHEHYIPNRQLRKPGILYISKEFKTAIYLCACGCGQQSATPLREGEWTLTENAGKVTLRPSIGNFKGEYPYHAHYLITDNRIEWS